MNLNQLYYFKTVAKFQHFRKAANELNISQPSLSLAISNLEKELGTYLSEDENGIYGLVSEGFGIAVVAYIMNPDNFKIKQIKINDSNCNRSIYMAYKKNTYQVPAVKKFIKYVKNTSKDIFIV